MENGSILGTFEGKSCDADVVNNNGMYLSRELFDVLLNSEEYQTAIKNRYYIGFLGHPEDPNCMDFRNACVVMTSMEMDSNGDIIASFDLVDTPVGRVVKSFIDAGVHFGISIRGAGDVAMDGTVDPDTFVFRGFDLVTFPAYNDCVPEFKEIAASSDVKEQMKYKKVCASVSKNLDSINSAEALSVMQEQFNENSDMYEKIQDRMNEVSEAPVHDDGCCDADEDVYVEVLEQKVKGLTKAYVDKVRECKSKESQLSVMSASIKEAERKNARKAEIVAGQMYQADAEIKKLKSMCAAKDLQVKASTQSSNQSIRQVKQLAEENSRLVEASEGLRRRLKSVNERQTLTVKSNLVSDKKIQASESLLRDKENSIRSLEADLSKTVAENRSLQAEVSNLEADVSSLKSRVEASEKLIFEYQQAYAESCAYAAGISLDNIPVTASTSVDDLRSYILSRAAAPVDVQTDSNELFDSYMDFDDQGDEGLVIV